MKRCGHFRETGFFALMERRVAVNLPYETKNLSRLLHCFTGLTRDEQVATFGGHQKIRSGNCNQATKPKINESLLIVVIVLTSVR